MYNKNKVNVESAYKPYNLIYLEINKYYNQLIAIITINDKNSSEGVKVIEIIVNILILI